MVNYLIGGFTIVYCSSILCNIANWWYTYLSEKYII
jgi:hypothetical protein